MSRQILHSFPTRRSSHLERLPLRSLQRFVGREPVAQSGIEPPHQPRRVAIRDGPRGGHDEADRKSTRLNSSHSQSSYAVFCLKKKMSRKIILIKQELLLL